MSTSDITSHPVPISLLEAAERRAREGPVYDSAAQQLKEHELKQTFRRMIQTGILRPNPKPIALEAMKIMITLGENILREPNEPKYLKFKPTNSTIKTKLVEPKGTIEYCREMGWDPEVQNFQPFYVFDTKKMTELELGVAMLKEALDLETAKQERELQNKREEKAAREAVKTNVKLAFMDDRKTKAALDAREKQRREARGSALPPEPMSSPEIPDRPMPGEGRSLSGQVVPAQPISPPPYTEDD